MEKNTSNTKIRIRKDEILIDVQGTEDFIEKQINKFNEVIQTGFRELMAGRLEQTIDTKKPVALENAGEVEDIEFVDTSNGLESIFEKCSNVLKVEKNKVRIFADIPGNSVSKKIVNFTLIYSWAKNKLGFESIAFKELRDECEKYGVVDRTHFASVLKRQKEIFLFDGSGHNQLITLTTIGSKRADKLIDELNKIYE